jgi:hypothetical protein
MRLFGDVPGVAVGTEFPDRQALHNADVHRPYKPASRVGGTRAPTPSSSQVGTKTTRTTATSLSTLAMGARIPIQASRSKTRSSRRAT